MDCLVRMSIGNVSLDQSRRLDQGQSKGQSYICELLWCSWPKVVSIQVNRMFVTIRTHLLSGAAMITMITVLCDCGCMYT